MAHPLRRVIFGTAILMVVLLGGLLTLGVRQYQLLAHHEQIVTQSEKLLFQFATIREHITATLLEQHYHKLTAIVPEVENLQTNINKMVENANIPDEYKLSFINQVDLPGIILLLYKSGSGEMPGEAIQQLNRETRQLGDRLMLFDRVLVNYAKRKIISFQSMVIGVLALAVFLLVNMLLLGHRRLATPLIDLAGQVREVDQGQRDGVTLASGDTAAEVLALATAFQDLLASRLRNTEEMARHNRVFYAVHRAGLVCRQASSRETLFQEVSRALLFNEDYCLVWVGTIEEENDEVTPVAVDGSTSMSRDEAEKCMAALLAAAEDRGPDHNPALQAARTGKPVISTDLLKGIPKGMLKGTPLIAGHAACTSLPLQWQQRVYGVLSVYTLHEACFDEREVELLAGLTGAMGLALHIFEDEHRRRREEERSHGLIAALESPLLTLSPQGKILAANPAFHQLSDEHDQAILGRNWRSLLEATEPERVAGKTDPEILATLSKGGQEIELRFKGGDKKQRLRCRFTPILEHQGRPLEYACLCHPVGTATMDRQRLPRQAVISELSAGVSHEISDLSNGIINYAQVLSDDASAHQQDRAGGEILTKIIDSGERIAEIVHKLIFYGQKNGTAVEYLPLATVLDDAVMLISHHLKTEGIQLDLNLTDRPLAIPVHAQLMQQILIGLFNHRRHSLNRRYGARDTNKRLAVYSENVLTDGERLLRISFTDRGGDLSPEAVARFTKTDSADMEIFDSALRELARCRELIESQGGTLQIDTADGETTTISISFPLKG